jgi:hypothetical protein
MTKCRIGADELILWLRKNNIGNNIPNDGFNGLGQKIRSIIEDQLSGKKDIDNFPAYWANESTDKNIGKFKLPKTSEQYLIDFDKLSDLYKELNKL